MGTTRTTEPSDRSPELIRERHPERRKEFRNVIAMTIPLVVTTSSRAVMDIVDYTMIARLNLPEALAAILPAQIIMWSYIIFGLGIASVINTFASQSMGKKEYHRCGIYAWQGIYLSVVFGLIGLALYPLLPSLLSMIGHDPKVQALELAYGNVALLTVGPTIAANALGWFFVGIHKPWATMWSAIEANVVNIVVSCVLIFGYLGFEPMGIAGAAWGTLCAVCYRTVRLLVTLWMPSINEVFHTRSSWRPNWSEMKNIIRVGIPCSFQWICEVVVWAVFVNILIGKKFGTVHLIATNTTWQYMRIAFFPTIGVGQALTALVGKSIGAGKPERAVREARFAVIITCAYMFTLSIIYWFFGATLISWFNADPEVIEIGRKIMICAAVFQLFDAIGITYSSALRGAGDTFVPSMFFVISNWVIIVGGGWYVATYYPQFGSLGPWFAASTLIIVAGIFLWWRWHSRAWMKINIFGPTSKEKEIVTKKAQELTEVLVD